MKLEEALPWYREGRTIISCNNNEYCHCDPLDAKACDLGCAGARELLGEWTVKKEKRVVKRTVWLNIYDTGLTSSHNDRRVADSAAQGIPAHRITCVKVPFEYEVEE